MSTLDTDQLLLIPLRLSQNAVVLMSLALATDTDAIDYGEGVEADGDDQLTDKLDGTTLTSCYNGLHVGR